MRKNERRRAAIWAELRASLALSWPLVLTNAAQTLLTATDVVFLGWVGPDALAAGALGANLYLAFVIFGVGLVGAVSPLVAIELGRRRSSVRAVRRAVRQGFWGALLVSAPVLVVLWNAEAFLRWIGEPPDLAAAAGGYLRVLEWAMPLFLLFLVLRSFIAALQRPVWGLVVGTAAIAVNALGNYALVLGHFGLPAMGLRGSALATVMSSLFMFASLALVVVCDRRFRRYALFGHLWRPDRALFRQFWRIGLPIGATVAFEVTVFNIAALLMGRIGRDSLAAFSIAFQIIGLLFMVPLGLGQAATVRVGLAFGAGDRAGIARAGWTIFAVAMIYAAGTATLLLLVPRALIGLFLNRADPANTAVVEIAVSFLSFAAVFQIADNAQGVVSGMLRGLRDARVPMLFAAVGYWAIGLPVGAALAFGAAWQGNGILAGLTTGLFVVAGLMLTRWLRRHRFVAGFAP